LAKLIDRTETIDRAMALIFRKQCLYVENVGWVVLANPTKPWIKIRLREAAKV
jgi:hypothetical protein